VTGGTIRPRPGKPRVTEQEVDGDRHTFAVRFSRSDGRSDGCTLLITATSASVWRVSEREAAETIATTIDTAVPRPLPAAFRFADDTVPPSLPLGALCQEIVNGNWNAFVAP
jgi:hypothetical protein